jgi:hypothetical protein
VKTGAEPRNHEAKKAKYLELFTDDRLGETQIEITTEGNTFSSIK